MTIDYRLYYLNITFTMTTTYYYYYHHHQHLWASLKRHRCQRQPSHCRDGDRCRQSRCGWGSGRMARMETAVDNPAVAEEAVEWHEALVGMRAKCMRRWEAESSHWDCEGGWDFLGNHCLSPFFNFGWAHQPIQSLQSFGMCWGLFETDCNSEVLRIKS